VANRWAHRLLPRCRVLVPTLLVPFGLAALLFAPAPPVAPSPDAGDVPAADPDAPGAYNTCDRQPAGARFRITLPEQADLADLVRWMTTVSCRKFIWNPAVRGGKVTIIAPEPVTLAQAYAAFDSALESMGLTTEDAGDYFKIVETTGVVGRNLPVLDPDEDPAPGDRFVTRLVRPEHGDSTEIAGVLSHLKSERGSVERVGDLIVVTDTGSSVRRLLEVLEQIDLPAQDDTGLFVLTLQNADPEHVKEVVLEVFGESAGASPRKAAPAPAPTPARGKTGGASSAGAAGSAVHLDAPAVARVVVDARTRALVMRVRRGDLPAVRALVERLDRELPGQSGRIHLVKLRHADPEEVAAVLGTFVKSGAAAPDSKAPTVRHDVTVTADPATRSLLIDATPHDFAGLRPVIESLDVERKQLYIEVYLLEVAVDHKLGTGVSGHFAKENERGDVSFVKNQPGDTVSSLSPFDGGDLAGLAAGILGRPVFVPQLGRDVPSFGVVLQAIATDSDVNVVSEPHLYAADNKPAKISVGQKVPVQTEMAFPGGAGGNSGNTPVASFSREDVSLTLELTPHVNDDGEVTLDVKLEDEEIVKAEGTQVTTTQRMLELEDVTARDGQPVVLGGLVKEVERVTNSKVPGLGSIPLLGWLFKSHRGEKIKLNLLIVLVPHVLDSPDDAHRIHTRRMQERQEFLERESAFQRRDLSTHVNYRKKAGLLAGVDAEARRMTREADDIALAGEQLEAASVEEIGAPATGP
jgi:general secretion pathway protein D